MTFIQTLSESKRIQEEFRHFERMLDLPVGSIESEYEKRLVLKGIPISEAKSILAELLKIATETVFSFDDVMLMYDRISDISIIRTVCEYSSSRVVDPHSIISLMLKE